MRAHFMSNRTTLSLFSNLLQLRQSCHSIARQVINNMADRQVQIELTKMKLELKRLLLSTIAILEEGSPGTKTQRPGIS